ncbi:MAG TPA: AraC family transcriptional regulator [Bryobacteraceae bacterium]|nr:AraC family transcriptional regulator [Bryobacteraceae bacterium]
MTTLNPSFETNQRKMKALLLDLTEGEGMRSTIVDGVKLARANRGHARAPVLYEPGIFVIASGRKKGYIGDRVIVYDENNYLVLSVPLPFECETDVGANEGPLLAISVRMDVSLISELAVRMDIQQKYETAAAADGCMRATPLDVKMSDAIVRLLECLRSAMDASVLAPGIVREIAYHALCGPQGGALFAMLNRNGPSGQIYALLQRIHTRYTEPLNVTRMAEEVGMSVSAFHHSFKAITASSPLQYLKSVRLHKARMLIMHEGIGAALAADRVGYESASQFSREFRRLFGTPPMEDSRRAQQLLAATVSQGAGAQ